MICFRITSKDTQKTAGLDQILKTVRCLEVGWKQFAETWTDTVLQGVFACDNRVLVMEGW